MRVLIVDLVDFISILVSFSITRLLLQSIWLRLLRRTRKKLGNGKSVSNIAWTCNDRYIYTMTTMVIFKAVYPERLK